MITDETYADDINNKIFNSLADVFQQAQETYAGHRKHVAVLKKIQSKATAQGYSDAFNYWFNKLVTSVLPLKKSEIIGDRIVKLIAAFVASLDKENELISNKRKNEELDDNLSEKEKITTKFIDGFIRHILRGVESKDKNVRFRVMQLLVVIMDNIGEIDVNLYNLLMWSLKKRIYDKEPIVRIQAVFCLTKLQSDDEDYDQDMDEESGETKATDTLMHLIQNDPSAEVRRATMLNIINNENTRAHILERARDINPINRRLVYSRVLKLMGKRCFTDLNPRILDQLMEWGLEDREEPVRKACQRLMANHWVNLFNGDLIELLENLDVVNSKSAVTMMESLFSLKPEILSQIKLTEEIWNKLTVEFVFLFRCFFIYSLENNLIEDVDGSFPEASRLANYLNVYISKRFLEENEDLSSLDKTHLEFIIEQLLITAHRYDYSDEIGRRSMLTVIRNMLNITDLSDSLIKSGHEVLKVLSINEKDFISMAIEIINDIRDDDIENQEQEETEERAKKAKSKDQSSKNGDDIGGNDYSNDDVDNNPITSFHSAVENLVNGNEPVNEDALSNIQPEREARPQAILLCLTRACYMLELVTENVSGNILITSLIDTLITPAVRNSESTIRELGVKCLGLCCLLDLQLSIGSMYILGMCISKGNASLKYIALQVIVDIFSVHGTAVVDGEGKVDSISIHKIFYKVLKNDEHKDCQVIAAEGLCKLYLADIFTDDDLFEALILSYFSPVNSANEALVQAFAFCVPVYCFSHKSHQQRMCRIACDMFLRLCILWDGLQNSEDPEVDKEKMMKPNMIFQQLVFWTDPRKIVNQREENYQSEVSQLKFLLEILKAITQIENRAIKRMVLTNLNTFYITSHHGTTVLEELMMHLEDILENEQIDTISRNSLEKFENTVVEAVETARKNSPVGSSETSMTSDELTTEQYSQILESSQIVEKEVDFEKENESDILETNNLENDKETNAENDPIPQLESTRKRDRSAMETSDDIINIIPTKELSGKNVSFAISSDSNNESLSENGYNSYNEWNSDIDVNMED
ncbi:similar to Saccharomyces cerevisiae YDR325W YCG1 Subunit of the condensin complex [Maudiozyma saulgeensis]|uniref:Similar to Saccharomyces cerevisiae YDR325W YCG1 Subunit of the condensin complex n=1 Tax=Maudiozyma saulgeensis TaxID=1789683 RepID=A0A1X7R2G8_9SACH|nr:similar to Saccharomyces cerevisiae YDR325W YCG1 Subunit of the condensin complex [Kazachstania saulgeensis]